jgi:hypothetical protein
LEHWAKNRRENITRVLKFGEERLRVGIGIKN